MSKTTPQSTIRITPREHILLSEKRTKVLRVGLQSTNRFFFKIINFSKRVTETEHCQFTLKRSSLRNLKGSTSRN